MFRFGLPVAVFLCAGAVFGNELRIPGLSPEATPPKLDLPPCENTQGRNNCARVLACIGNDGLWFDGQARGWNEGALIGQRSDGVVCAGNWAYGGLFGTATAKLECEDGLTGQAIFYAEDSLTGTGRARGFDSRGRSLRVWTGQNVLEFLGDGIALNAKLPCTDAAIPIS